MQTNAEQLTEELQAETVRCEELSLVKEKLEREQRSLGQQLLEETTYKHEIQQDIKKVEASFEKSKAGLEDTKKVLKEDRKKGLQLQRQMKALKKQTADHETVASSLQNDITNLAQDIDREKEQSIRRQIQSSEAEKTKLDLEKQLMEATRQIAKDHNDVERRARRQTKKGEKDQKLDSQIVQEQVLFDSVDGQSGHSVALGQNKKDMQQTKVALESKLADLTAEFELSSRPKKKERRSKEEKRNRAMTASRKLVDDTCTSNFVYK